MLHPLPHNVLKLDVPQYLQQAILHLLVPHLDTAKDLEQQLSAMAELLLNIGQLLDHFTHFAAIGQVLQRGLDVNSNSERLIHGSVDRVSNVIGGISGLLRERSNFAGDHRKTATGLAGSCRLDLSVQG